MSINESFVRNQQVGCKERKCACPNWINCPKYVDQQKQAWRLKQKEIDPKIQDWYKENFRGEITMADIVVNG